MARGFDGDADFVVAADFAVPKVLAGDGFVLHAGGKLLFQQQTADFSASSRVGAVVVTMTGLNAAFQTTLLIEVLKMAKIKIIPTRSFFDGEQTFATGKNIRWTNLRRLSISAKVGR